MMFSASEPIDPRDVADVERVVDVDGAVVRLDAGGRAERGDRAGHESLGHLLEQDDRGRGAGGQRRAGVDRAGDDVDVRARIGGDDEGAVGVDDSGRHRRTPA